VNEYRRNRCSSSGSEVLSSSSPSTVTPHPFIGHPGVRKDVHSQSSNRTRGQDPRLATQYYNQRQRISSATTPSTVAQTLGHPSNKHIVYCSAMPQRHRVYLAGGKVYGCRKCKTHLAVNEHIGSKVSISTRLSKAFIDALPHRHSTANMAKHTYSTWCKQTPRLSHNTFSRSIYVQRQCEVRRAPREANDNRKTCRTRHVLQQMRCLCRLEICEFLSVAMDYSER
jgi:hypothetical protein